MLAIYTVHEAEFKVLDVGIIAIIIKALWQLGVTCTIGRYVTQQWDSTVTTCSDISWSG